MKKVILMLAFAASLMVVSCGKGNGKAAGSDSAAALEQTADAAAEALPTEPFTLKIRGVSGGEWDNFKPCLGEAKFTLGAEEGDMVNLDEVNIKGEKIQSDQIQDRLTTKSTTQVKTTKAFTAIQCLNSTRQKSLL